MAATSQFKNEESLICELHSESTLPFLSYLVQCKQNNHNGSTDAFHKVKSGVGKAPRAIPDESEQLQDVLLSLIEKGPSGDGGKIPGSPTVSFRHYCITSVILILYRSRLLVPEFLVFAPAMS